MDATWPPRYTDPDTGHQHAWDDEVPPDEDGYDDGTGPYTYRDMVHDQASAQGMEVGEYLEHLAWRRNPLHDEDGLSPSWIEDGDGYGQ